MTPRDVPKSRVEKPAAALMNETIQGEGPPSTRLPGLVLTKPEASAALTATWAGKEQARGDSQHRVRVSRRALFIHSAIFHHKKKKKTTLKYVKRGFPASPLPPARRF